jgi:valyl-tRNA synthetase
MFGRLAMPQPNSARARISASSFAIRNIRLFRRRLRERPSPLGNYASTGLHCHHSDRCRSLSRCVARQRALIAIARWAGARATPYCIMIPPPNVTGTLHMGHAFQDTIMDALTRYHRMQGCNTLWQPGTDHAGIATQMVVERQLAAEGKTRHDLGRESVHRKGVGVEGGIRRHDHPPVAAPGRLGGLVARTLHDGRGLSAAVREVFVRLYEEGLIYRGKRLVNWDPVLHTAVSDLEVLSAEENGFMWHLRYPLADGRRPSGRRHHPPGNHARRHRRRRASRRRALPASDRPACAPAADRPLIPGHRRRLRRPEFGTGCVKITPAHDFNDYEVGQRHKPAADQHLHADAKINDNGPAAYRGLDRFEARKRVVADLEAWGLLEKIEPHKLMVPRGDRSRRRHRAVADRPVVRQNRAAGRSRHRRGQDRHPFVPGKLGKDLLSSGCATSRTGASAASCGGATAFRPGTTSRGKVYVGRRRGRGARQKHTSAGRDAAQDEDVLDTWFSSALWPFSTLGWPEQTEELKTFYPTSVLVTGFDIIFFWVARMIMMGLKFMGEVPFREVYITAWCATSTARRCRSPRATSSTRST